MARFAPFRPSKTGVPARRRPRGVRLRLDALESRILPSAGDPLANAALTLLNSAPGSPAAFVQALAAGGTLTILLILANSSKATAGLFTFVILLSTSAILFVYTLGVLAAWKDSGSRSSHAILGIALLFIAFAFYGAGLEADLWSLALLAGGLAIRLILGWLNGSSRAAASTSA